MYLIVGLGNPENKYANTRHNVGFDTINEIAKKNKIDVNRTKFEALYGQGTIGDEKVILLKPQMYMNLSGIPTKKIKDFFKIDDDKVIIIQDDIDVTLGTIKVRKNGGAGTHNGMKSIVEQLGNRKFYRIKIGIGKPEENQDLADFVLSNIEDRTLIDEAVVMATNAVEMIVEEGIDKAMNQYN